MTSPHRIELQSEPTLVEYGALKDNFNKMSLKVSQGWHGSGDYHNSKAKRDA
jgi:hypothetical protein